MRGEIIRTVSCYITKWICDTEDEFQEQIPKFQESYNTIDINSVVDEQVKLDDVQRVVIYTTSTEPLWVTLCAVGHPVLLRLDPRILYSLDQTNFTSIIIGKGAKYL